MLENRSFDHMLG
jgi:pimeloyl-ACP methyl ester carboxylesterase